MTENTAVGYAPVYEETAAERYFDAEKRARALQADAIRELRVEREKHETAIQQIDQQLSRITTAEEVIADSKPTAVRKTKAAKGKRIISEETRAKMRAGQERRRAAMRRTK